MTPDESQVTRPSLLLRVRDNTDGAAWGRFVDEYTPLVYHFCRKRGLQPADAADVAQEVMKAAALALPRFEYQPQRGRFRDWLFRVTRNKLSDLVAARRRQPAGSGETAVHEVLHAQPDPGEREAWDRAWMRQAFDSAAEAVRGEFEPATWQAFWESAVEGRPVKEVAQGLGLTAGAVYVARCRVLARLRDEVGQVDE